jgi:hypothetical protein
VSIHQGVKQKELHDEWDFLMFGAVLDLNKNWSI